MGKSPIRVLAKLGSYLGANCGCCGVTPLPPPGFAKGLLAQSMCAACWADWPPPWAGGSPLEVQAHRPHGAALWPYQGSLRRLLVQAKEDVRGAPCTLLRWAIAEEIQRRAQASAWPSCRWMPVPPSWKRRWRGAYLPERLGPVAAKAFAGHWCGGIKRVKQVSAQTGLSGERRRRNLDHAFAYPGDAPKILTVFDDVRTTGASLHEARRAARAAGAQEVWQLAVAAVP